MATMEHPAYVEQMLLSSPSPNHLEPQAEKKKETINNPTDLHERRWIIMQFCLVSSSIQYKRDFGLKRNLNGLSFV